jgi:hypothetical protein
MIEIYERRNYAVLRDSVEIEFYNDRGEHTTTLTAELEKYGVSTTSSLTACPLQGMSAFNPKNAMPPFGAGD